MGEKVDTQHSPTLHTVSSHTHISPNRVFSRHSLGLDCPTSLSLSLPPSGGGHQADGGPYLVPCTRLLQASEKTFYIAKLNGRGSLHTMQQAAHAAMLDGRD